MRAYDTYVKGTGVIMPKLLPAKDLGRKLRSLRDERGWSQPEFARRSGRDQAEISKWENGKIQPAYDTAVMLAEALGVDVSVFLQGERAERGHATVEMLGVPDRILEAWLSDARAAERRAEALVKFAEAARLAEENARHRQQAFSPDAWVRETAEVGAEGIETVLRQEATQTTDSPLPTKSDRPASGQGRVVVE